MKGKSKIIIYSIILVAFGSLVLYRIIKTSNQAKGNEAGRSKGNGKSVQVNGVVAQVSGFSNSISVSGSIEADQQVQIISQVSGLVQAIYFKEGSYVHKGQLLVSVDDIELRAQLAQALTKEKLAAETEKRASLLIKSGAISQQEYDVAHAELKSLEAQTQLINAQISKTKIKAPFSGRIGLSTITAGEYLSPSTLIANLVSLDPIKISFSVPEKYSGQVNVNTDIDFMASGSEKKYKASIYAIEPGIETETRTLQIKARGPNPGNKLLPGAFVQVVLPVSSVEQVILIPTEAIIPVQNGQKVYVTDKGKAREVMVKTSTRTDKDIVVTEGLAAGDTVITTGNMALKPGAAVKVVLASPKQDTL